LSGKDDQGQGKYETIDFKNMLALQFKPLKKLSRVHSADDVGGDMIAPMWQTCRKVSQY